MASILQKRVKIVLLLALAAAAGFLFYYFISIVIAIVLAVVMALLGRPLTNYLCKIKFGKRRMSVSLAATITLTVFYLSFLILISMFIPLIIEEVQLLSTIEPKALVDYMSQPIDGYVKRLQDSGVDITTEKIIDDYVVKNLSKVFNGNLVNNVVEVLSGFTDVLTTVLSASFIAFFFLEDPGLVQRAVMSLAPDSHSETMERVIQNSKNLLRRYFIGLFLQTSAIIILVFIGLSIFGIKNALLIACFAGVTNIIPYIGPLIAVFFTTFVVASTGLQDPKADILSLVLIANGVQVGVNVIDNMFLGPLIFSNSVKVHPLEIFIVILVAARMGGITGMLVAIPAYTVVRVLFTEFLDDLKDLKAWLQDV